MALLLLQNLVLQKFEVLPEDLDRKAIKVHCLSAGLVDPDGLFLDLFVFENDVLLNGEHLVPEGLNCHKFIIRLCLLDFKENLQNFVILILDVNQAQLLFLVLPDEADQLAALLDLVE